jgi:hypothetical protein
MPESLPDLAGCWLIDGYPPGGRGLMHLEVARHNGDAFTGELRQLLYPNPTRPVDNPDRDMVADVDGHLVRTPGSRTVVMSFVRRNRDGRFAAVFSGLTTGQADRFDGHFFNTAGHIGRFVMYRGLAPADPMTHQPRNP